MHRGAFFLMMLSATGWVACGDASNETPPYENAEAATSPDVDAAPTSSDTENVYTLSDVQRALGTIESRRFTDDIALRCEAALIAPDKVLTAAHCFDWFRDRADARIVGEHVFIDAAGVQTDVAAITLHPRYAFVSCDMAGGATHAKACWQARRQCATRYATSWSRMLQCQRNVERRVREIVGGPTYDVAVVRLARSLRHAPIPLAKTLQKEATSLHWFGRDGNPYQTYITSRETPDFKAKRIDVSERMALVFADTQQGVALTGIASRVNNAFETPKAGESEMLFCSVADQRSWLNDLLGTL